MNHTMKSFLVSFLTVVLICLSMTACTTPSTSNLVVALNAIADSSSVSVVIINGLAISGTVSPAVVAEVSAYAQGISGAVTTSITELNSADSNPQKIVAISTAFAAVAAPAFGPSTSPQIVAVINAVGSAVKLFLSQLNGPSLKTAATLAPHTKIVLEKGDKATLKKIQAKVAATKAKAIALKK
jgi:hypothetical protein